MDIDFVLDILGYVGVGLVNMGLMLLISYVLSRRPTQTMYIGENMIKRVREAAENPPVPISDDSGEGGEKLVTAKPADDENNGDWDMAFNIVKKRHGRGDWHMAFYFSILEIFILSSLLMFIYTAYSLLKSIGLGVLMSGALFFLMIFLGKIFTRGKELTKALRVRLYMIYTISTCAVSGTIITLMFIKWDLFEFI